MIAMGMTKVLDGYLIHGQASGTTKLQHIEIIDITDQTLT
jgi:hypothetical protein